MADTVGIRVNAIRYGATVFGGLLAGLGGAYFSTLALDVFLENMTGGAGWIAGAIVIFGNWSPWGIVFLRSCEFQKSNQAALGMVPSSLLPLIKELLCSPAQFHRNLKPLLHRIEFARWHHGGVAMVFLVLLAMFAVFAGLTRLMD